MKARKMRQRSISVADDEEGDDGASEALRKSVAARKQQKEKKGGKKPSLSFDDEEEPQVVPIKRPPSKIRPDLKGLKIAYPDVAKQSTQRSAPGDYSAEKLLELQRNTVRLPSSKPAVDASQAVPPPAFKLSGSFKQAGAQTSVPQAKSSASAQARQDADDDMPLPPPARPASRPPLPPSLPSQARARPGAADDDDLPSFQAPDEDTIRKIKERRARLQHVHMAPDYIPVAGAAMDTLRNDAKAESGSGSDSEPDAGDQLRMSFLGDTKKRETFTTHPWIVRLKDSQQVLGHYMGESAVVEVSPSMGCIIHPGAAKHICPRPVPTPLHWGAYHQRRSVKGIAIMAFDLVPEAAMSAAAEALSYMLADTPSTICKRLAGNDADIAVIGRDQVVSDMPPHSHLRGQSCAIGDRTFDHGTRGVGGNMGCPTCSVGEENVTMLDDKHYSQENILIHEFAHSVMCIGMDDEQRQSICGAYEEAKQSGLYQKHIYMMANADEYWAEATQSWFDATIRTDVNDGFNTRDKIKAHDPMLAMLLMHAYGDGPWRYTHTMPRNWGGRPRSSPVQHPQHQPSSYDQQVRQPVLAPTQTMISFQHHSPQYGQFGGHQAQAQPQRRSRNSSFCCFPFAFLRQSVGNKFH